MAIEFRCENPECNKLLAGQDGWAGRRIDCPACGRSQHVPGPAGPAAGQPSPRPDRPVPRGADDDEGRLRWLGYTLAANKGKLIGLAALAVVVGAAWLMLYTLSSRSDQPANVGDTYVQSLLSARRKAEALAADTTLRSLHSTLVQFATMNRSRFPQSLRSMIREMQASSELIQTPSGEMLGYVPGQRTSSPAGNILVYAPAPGRDGTRTVLRVDGSIDHVSEDAFQAQMTRQGASPAETQPSAP